MVVRAGGVGRRPRRRSSSGSAALPTVVLLRRAGTLWSLPAGRAAARAWPACAGAWPALAAQAARARGSARALGALGGWWLALAEVLTGDRLALGAPPGAALDAAHLDPLLTSGALALAALWARRRRRAPVSGARPRARRRRRRRHGVGGGAWDPRRRPSPVPCPGSPRCALVAGAVVAGGLAVACAASRGEAYGRSAS